VKYSFSGTQQYIHTPARATIFPKVYHTASVNVLANYVLVKYK